MPSISRGTDSVTTGHGCDTITTLETNNTGLSSNVFINGLPVSCVGDKTIIHQVPGGSSCVPHQEVIKSGSATVFCGGKAVAKIGDSCDNGAIISGSANVFCS